MTTDPDRGVQAGEIDVRLEPVPTDDRRAILTGVALWAVALVATLLMRDRLAEQGREWWTWVCVAGLILGAMGVGYLQTHGRWGRSEHS